MTLNARASSSLRATPRVVGVGQSLRLSGTVRGVIPSRGVPVIFQGRGSSGRLGDVRRRPRQPQGPLPRPLPLPLRLRARPTFTFRVKLRGDARFPYALGYSKRVRVRVR